MVEISNKTSQVVYFPKTYAGSTTSLSLRIHSELSQKDWYFDVQDLASLRDYYKFRVDFSGVDDGEFNYCISEEDDVLDSGLIRIGVPQSNNRQYRDDDIEVIQYDMYATPEIRYQSKSVSYDRNGNYTVLPDEGYAALSEVDITVNVPSYSGASYESGYTDGYASGRTDGYGDGWQPGYNSGYTDGYNSGMTVGYNSGYSAGASASTGEAYNSGFTNGYNSGYSAGQQAAQTTAYNSGYSAGIAYQKGLLVSTAFTQNGTYTRENGYSSVNVNVSCSGYPWMATAITLNVPSAITDYGQATATVSPSTATTQLVFACDNTGIADIDPDTGEITVKSDGTAIIRVTDNLSMLHQSKTVEFHKSVITSYIQATYNVTSTTDPTKILCASTSFVAAESPSGTPIELSSAHTFSTTGSNDVFYYMTGDTLALNTFKDTDELVKVIVNEGVRTLDDHTFCFCDNLEEVQLPDSLRGTLRCFAKNPKLTKINVPSGITELGNSCFDGCTSLSSITIPGSVTKLGNIVFRDNYSLADITIPESVEEIGERCFWDCSGLTAMTFEGITPPAFTSPLYSGDTLGNTAYTFPIYVPCEAVEDYKSAYTTYASRITCIDPYDTEFLTFECVSAGTLSFKNYGGNIWSITYRKNGGSWENINSNSTGNVMANMNVGDIVEVKGENTRYAYDLSNYASFAGSGFYNIYGDLSSLNNWSASNSTYKFACLFMTFNVVDASHLNLANVNVTDACFFRTFNYCENLIAAPELPASALASSCYTYMFNNCQNLVEGPSILPATTLVDSCYFNMFNDCRKLTNAPAFTANTVGEWSCYCMFKNCWSLTTAAPTLNATTMQARCYSEMFSGCSGLTAAPALPATTLALSCYTRMFSSCVGLTQAPTLPATSLANWCYAYMFNGCTGIRTAPDLIAENMSYYGYDHMFDNCTNLNYVKCLATDAHSGNEQYYTTGWLNNVAATGTFVKNANASWSRGTSQVPLDWTIVDAS